MPQSAVSTSHERIYENSAGDNQVVTNGSSDVKSLWKAWIGTICKGFMELSLARSTRLRRCPQCVDREVNLLPGKTKDQEDGALRKFAG